MSGSQTQRLEKGSRTLKLNLEININADQIKIESGFPVSLLGWANSNVPPSKLATSANCLSPGMNKTELQGSSCKKTHKQKYPLLRRLSPLAKRPSRHLLISLKGIH